MRIPSFATHAGGALFLPGDFGLNVLILSERAFYYDVDALGIRKEQRGQRCTLLGRRALRTLPLCSAISGILFDLVTDMLPWLRLAFRSS